MTPMTQDQSEFKKRRFNMNVLVAISDEYFGQAILSFMSGRQWDGGTRVRLLHVQEPAPAGSLAKEKAAEAARVDDRCQTGSELLEDFACKLAAAQPNLEIEKIVATGNTADEILSVTERWPADLIVLGSHGRKGLDRLLLGSVSLAVTAGSSCSVAIIKPPLLMALDVKLSEEEDMPQQMCSFDLSDTK